MFDSLINKSLIVLLFMLLPLSALAANGQSCRVTVQNQSEQTTILVGFKQPLPHAAQYVVPPDSTTVLQLKPGGEPMLFVGFLLGDGGVHRGEIVRADMGRHIDCVNGKPVGVAVRYRPDADGPTMAISY